MKHLTLFLLLVSSLLATGQSIFSVKMEEKKSIYLIGNSIVSSEVFVDSLSKIAMGQPIPLHSTGFNCTFQQGKAALDTLKFDAPAIVYFNFGSVGKTMFFKGKVAYKVDKNTCEESTDAFFEFLEKMKENRITFNFLAHSMSNELLNGLSKNNVHASRYFSGIIMAGADLEIQRLRSISSRIDVPTLILQNTKDKCLWLTFALGEKRRIGRCTAYNNTFENPNIIFSNFPEKYNKGFESTHNYFRHELHLINGFFSNSPMTASN